MAGFTALAQNDIKKVLAFSTVSQIGYMFSGSRSRVPDSSAIFHLMTHAFFKALYCSSRRARSFWPCITSRTSSKWAACAKICAWCTCIILDRHISLGCDFPRPQASAVRKKFWPQHVTHEHGGSFFTLARRYSWGRHDLGLYSFRLYFLVFYGKKTHDGHEVMGWHLQGPLVALAIAFFSRRLYSYSG